MAILTRGFPFLSLECWATGGPPHQATFTWMGFGDANFTSHYFATSALFPLLSHPSLKKNGNSVLSSPSWMDLLCIPGWPRICRNSPLPLSWMLGLQSCPTLPAGKTALEEKCLLLGLTSWIPSGGSSHSSKLFSVHHTCAFVHTLCVHTLTCVCAYIHTHF